MAAAAQEKTLSGFLADLGVVGFSGIAASIGSPNTKLVVTVTQPAWAVLADGTVLASELATTAITGLSTNGDYHLWLTATKSGTDYTPVWTVAASAPDATALKVADLTVGSNHLTAVTNVATGLQSLPQQQSSFAPTTPTFPDSTVFVRNTTGAAVTAYLGLSGVTQTHIYVGPAGSSSGAIDLTTQAPGTVIIPNNYYFGMTYSAGTPTWVWQGLRSQ